MNLIEFKSTSYVPLHVFSNKEQPCHDELEDLLSEPPQDEEVPEAFAPLRDAPCPYLAQRLLDVNQLGTKSGASPRCRFCTAYCHRPNTMLYVKSEMLTAGPRSSLSRARRRGLSKGGLGDSVSAAVDESNDTSLHHGCCSVSIRSEDQCVQVAALRQSEQHCQDCEKRTHRG